MSDPRRLIPRTDELLADPRLADLTQQLGRTRVKALVTEAQSAARAGSISPAAILDHVLHNAHNPRAVINATGVIVHTNLGRAPLSDAAISALTQAAGATDVEFDLATGLRAKRGRGAIAALAEAVPDAGGVHIVNNTAAALLLCAIALAGTREIVISRGELVEIGDGFRIPDLVASAGARLREVGTTNRTHLADYADAIGPDTAFVLKVHPSNFRVDGFTAAVPIAELATLGVPVIADIGSGLLAPHPVLPEEPDAATTLRAGADLVLASGDKLLGGPQAGLMLGRAELIQQLRRHPAARAMRVDKLTLAALEATLRGPATPVELALSAELAILTERATRLVTDLSRDGIDAQIRHTRAVIGGGGAPGVSLPSVAISLPEPFAAELRKGKHPVVGRLERGRCLLDLRTVAPSEDETVLAAVQTAATETAS